MLKMMFNIYLAFVDNMPPLSIFFLGMMISFINFAFYRNYSKIIYFENEPYLLFFSLILPITLYIGTFTLSIYRQRERLITEFKSFITDMAFIFKGMMLVIPWLVSIALIGLLLWGVFYFLGTLSVTTLLIIIIILLILR